MDYIKAEEREYYSFSHSICPNCNSNNTAITLSDSNNIIWTCFDCKSRGFLQKKKYEGNRNTTAFNTWAIKVKNRDHVCRICGSDENLEAHHIIPVQKSRCYDLDVNNGILLCHDCHSLIHGKADEYRISYMYKDKKTDRELDGGFIVVAISEEKALEKAINLLKNDDEIYWDIKCNGITEKRSDRK